MMTWAMFLGDDTDVDGAFSAARLTAAGTSAALHTIVVLAILAELPQFPARASEAATSASTIDVTVELSSPEGGALHGSTSRLLMAEPVPDDSPAPDQAAPSESASESAMAAKTSANKVPLAAEPEIQDSAVARVWPPK